MKRAPVFLNDEIIGMITFKPQTFQEMLDFVDIEGSTKDLLLDICEEMKRLPAALGDHHGGYEGGLHDHTVLVSNVAHQLCLSPRKFSSLFKKLNNLGVETSLRQDALDLKKVIFTSICHDLGKVSYYSFKKGLKDRKFKVFKKEVDTEHYRIKLKFGYLGRHNHVAECIAFLRKYDIPHDDEMLNAIIFHHGQWSRYEPHEPNELAKLIHVADMIASHIYLI